MKFLFTFLFITSIAFGQNDDLVLHNIKQQFLEITELVKKQELIEKEIEYSCEDQSISGNVTFYYQNQNLKLITHSFDQGHHYTFDNYYISDNILLFYFSQEGFDNHENIYDETTGDLIDVKEDWSASELRVYFNKEKAFKCLVKEYEDEDITQEIEEKYPEISTYFKNKKVDCENDKTKEILAAYYKLIEFQDLDIENICILH